MKARTRWSRWTTAAVVAGALLTGTVIGPAVVQAATAGLVRLEGGGSSHLAKVSSAGQLSVDTGLTQTGAHQILATEASPSSFINVTGPGNISPCTKGGVYQIPSGHALIITGADFDDVAANGAPITTVTLEYGPSAKPCAASVGFSASVVANDVQNQVFQPGVAVPAGDAISVNSSSRLGGVEFYGYLVPASDVPQQPATAGPVALPFGSSHFNETKGSGHAART